MSSRPLDFKCSDGIDIVWVRKVGGASEWLHISVDTTGGVPAGSVTLRTRENVEHLILMLKQSLRSDNGSKDHE
jgi:hypothetical protein